MKRLLLPALVLLAALVCPAQAAVDFSDLEGVYTGNYQLDTTTPAFLNGTLTARVSTNKSGKRLTIEFYGALAQFGSPASVGIFNQLQLKSNRQVISNSVLIGFFQLFPGASKFTGNNGRFNFMLANTSFNATTTYVLKFTKKRIVLTGTGTVSATPVNIVFKGKRK